MLVVASWSKYKQRDAGNFLGSAFGCSCLLQPIKDVQLLQTSPIGRRALCRQASLRRSQLRIVSDDFQHRPAELHQTFHTSRPSPPHPSQCSASLSPDLPDASPRLLLEFRPPSPAALLLHPSCLRPPQHPRPLFPPSDATRHTLVSQKMRFRAASSTS